MMHGHEKSDSVIVAVKPANKVGQRAADRTAAEPTAAELVERRAGTKGNDSAHGQYGKAQAALAPRLGAKPVPNSMNCR
jgi:hypothetical protein